MVDKLFPWQSSLMTSSSGDCVTTSQLIETVDALIHDDDQTQVPASAVASSFVILISIVNI